MTPTSGKLVILAMIALALAAAAASFWYHRATGARALEFWGPEAARHIARAPLIDVWEIGGQEGRPPHKTQRVAVAGAAIVRQWDASHARGVGNIRRTLIEDASYDWTRRSHVGGRWRYHLRFSDEHGHAHVWLSDEGTAAPKPDGPVVQLTPEAFASLKGFFDDLSVN